jgi:sugar phosphate isomerase/epimerase
MRVGIDTYSYHRFLGETYPVQSAADRSYSYIEVLEKAISLGIDGISLETCFLKEPIEENCRRLVDLARGNGLELILAWGHPLGLYGGDSDDAQEDMEENIRLCKKMNIDILRIVGSNRRLMADSPREVQRDRVTLRLKESVKLAEDLGVRLAIENHQDFLAEDILVMLEEVNSPHFGVNYDTGNSLRLQEDPVKAATLLAPHIIATHIKDVNAVYGGNPQDWTFFASVPAGRGIVDLPAVIDVINSAGYDGFFAIELDYLHPDFSDEFEVVEESIRFLKGL